MNSKDYELLKKQIGPRIWSGSDLFKAFSFGVLLGLLVMSPLALADELVHKFKNPSFSGVGTGAHYLTIENQQKSRKDKIRDDIEAELLRQQREEENSTLNKFLRNLESRIYSQISRQLVDQMFGNEEGADYGIFTIEGNTVTYERLMGEDGIEIIRLTIVDAEGSTTTIDIPVGVAIGG
jgi:hypothetical protein